MPNFKAKLTHKVILLQKDNKKGFAWLLFVVMKNDIYNINNVKKIFVNESSIKVIPNIINVSL